MMSMGFRLLVASLKPRSLLSRIINCIQATLLVDIATSASSRRPVPDWIITREVTNPGTPRSMASGKLSIIIVSSAFFLVRGSSAGMLLGRARPRLAWGSAEPRFSTQEERRYGLVEGRSGPCRCAVTEVPWALLPTVPCAFPIYASQHMVSI
ncbi:hypothetical protein L209DRAFT_504288 [Thermothelomyces heterothallicus CBS 203.75]